MYTDMCIIACIMQPFCGYLKVSADALETSFVGAWLSLKGSEQIARVNYPYAIVGCRVWQHVGKTCQWCLDCLGIEISR
jgi:hypothetical protein